MKIANFCYQPHDVIHGPERGIARYSTHHTKFGKRLHAISQAALLPAGYNLHLLSRTLQPLPGKEKENALKGLAIRIESLALFILSIPLALISAGIGVALRCLDHTDRRSISYYAPEKITAPPSFTKENPLKIRTHNLALVPTPMSVLNDLRDPLERAQEIVESVRRDEQRPDIIFFQEAFHEKACHRLFEGLKERYPYILYNIAPQITGFTSGVMVFSKFPLEEVEFRTFDHMIGLEKATARGVLRVGINTEQGKINLYGVHTQALLGEERALSRAKQLEDVARFMKEDAASCKGQVLVGDCNTSIVSVRGRNNRNRSEEIALNARDSLFTDPFLFDHDELGRRKSQDAHYLPFDNSSMGQTLPEPSGSWYVGPYSFIESHLIKIERKWRKVLGSHNPGRTPLIEVKNPPAWGTSSWYSSQPANTARFDYILFPKNDDRLDGRVEIRRVAVPAGTQSAPSDHLPVDGRIWLTEPPAKLGA